MTPPLGQPQRAAKGGNLLKALPITDAMKQSAFDLFNIPTSYDGGVTIGPASAVI